MITIKDVRTLDGKTIDYNIPSATDEMTIDAKKRLLLLPGVIDSHIYLGEPTQERWKLSMQAAVQGGITTIVDIPCSPYLCDSRKNMEEKEQLVTKQMEATGGALRYLLYSSAKPQGAEAIDLVKDLSKGVVIFPNLDQTIDDDAAWDRIFQLAAWSNMPVVINAKNENAVCKYTSKAGQEETFLEKAIYYARKQAANLYVLNVSKPEELYLIRHARKAAILVYAETTPQHLFPEDISKADFLWESLDTGLIDTVGSGYGLTGDGNENVNGANNWYGTDYAHLRAFLPLLLNAAHEKRISLQTIVNLTSLNIKEIFRFEKTRDVVLVDLEKELSIEKKQMKLIGCPEYTIVNGRVIKS